MIRTLLLKLVTTSRMQPITGQNSLAFSEYVVIGGVKQWLLIRGIDKTNPIILFLHAGPGFVSTGLAGTYQEELERHFVVVHMHQRGAGKSYSKNIPPESMILDRLVEDVREVSEYLMNKFDKDQICLVGQSFGSVLGLLATKKYPELFSSFISIGQITDVSSMEQKSYDFAMECATEANDGSSIKKLKKISREAHGLTLETMKIKQEIIHKYEGNLVGSTDITELIKLLIVCPPEHSFADVIRCIRGIRFSGKCLLNEALSVNLMDEFASLNVPSLFVVGENDKISMCSLVEKFFERLTLKDKKLVIFPNAAHFPNISFPKEFQQLLIEWLSNLENPHRHGTV